MSSAGRITSCCFLVLALTLGSVSVRSQAAPPQLTICHAGSVQAAFTAVENEFKRQHPDVTIYDISGASVSLAARLAAGTPTCDVFAAADYLDIDLLLKPIGLADYTIVFAKGRMVLAYVSTDPLAAGIAAPGEFKPPRAIPQAASDWYRRVLRPGVRIVGSHPFLDPSGYRSHMMFELAQRLYGIAGLYHQFLEHYMIIPAVGGSTEAPTLGNGYSFQLIYEHSAAIAAALNPAYRYVTLPDRIDLSTSTNSPYYATATVTIPNIEERNTKPFITIPGARVAWGLTIPKSRASQENGIRFVQLLLGATGSAALTENGPTPVTPARVGTDDYRHLPTVLQSLVAAGVLPP